MKFDLADKKELMRQIQNAIAPGEIRRQPIQIKPQSYETNKKFKGMLKMHDDMIGNLANLMGWMKNNIADIERQIKSEQARV